MAYLLDSNAISALVRMPQGAAAQRLEAVGNENAFTSIIVAAEVSYGVLRRGSRELAEKVAAVTGRLYVAGFDRPADEEYAQLRLALEKSGKTLSPNDMLIAAHALALNATLVTDDRAFERVPALNVDNWMR